jgi:hypothetical protein
MDLRPEIAALNERAEREIRANASRAETAAGDGGRAETAAGNDVTKGGSQDTA